MIVYQDTKHGARVGPPHWLVGADNVQSREGIDGRLWGIGDGMLLGVPDGARWSELPDGWRVYLGSIEPEVIRRRQKWADELPVAGVTDIVWMAPLILTPHGEPAYRAPLGGPDFLPMPTPEQKRAHDVALTARAALIQQNSGGPGVPVAAACQWAAILLSSCAHVPPELFRCGLMDEQLALQTCLAGSGLYKGD